MNGSNGLAPDETFHDRLLPMLRSPGLEIVGEFFAALRESFTWNPLKNSYMLFGLLWGLPIPIFSLGIDIFARDLALNAATVLGALEHHPIHFVFLAHPIIFAVVFGAMGTVRQVKDQKIQRLIGELERRLRELAEANDKLQSLDRLKTEFLANVSHELRTPLVSIRGYTEMILEGRLGPVTERQTDGLKVSVRNVERLLELINELLDFSRMQAGKLALTLTTFDLREVVRAAVTALRPRIDEKRLQLEEALPAEPIPITGDRDKLGRLVLNLLSNAVKFTPKGGGVGAEARAGVTGEYLIRVWDTGCGIPEQVHHRVFERFWQFDGSAKRQHGGTGLGLAIVKEIVLLHGGRIEFESGSGKGTTMKVTLPARPPAPALDGLAAALADAPAA